MAQGTTAAKSRNGFSDIDFRSLLLFQCAGIVFLLFYLPEQSLLIIRWGGLTGWLADTAKELFTWSFKISDTLQSHLAEYYAPLFALALLLTALTYAVIALLAIANSNPAILLRALLFAVIGALAIPAVLTAYSYGWIPVLIVSYVFAAFNFLIGIAVKYLFPVVAGLVIVFLVVTWLMQRPFIVRVIFLCFVVAAIILGVLYWNAFLEFTLPLIKALIEFLVPIFAVLGSVVAAILTFATLVLSVVLGAMAFALINSQFGHILIDTLLDARHVHTDARTAGRFFIGIGFIASLIILATAGNAYANTETVKAVGQLLTHSFLSEPMSAANDAVDAVTSGYLVFIPNEVESRILTAFKYGHAPSIELVAVILSLVLSNFFLLRQLFRKDRGGQVRLAFVPIELVFLLAAATIALAALLTVGDSGE